MVKENNLALYIHVPFCVSKCSYCNFCSFVPKAEQFTKYLNALKHEIQSRAKDLQNKQIFSIYIGGGTPSILPKNAIIDLIETIKANFDVLKDASITIEANPNTFSLEKAQEYKQAGCTRLSLGLQSHKPELLKLLNRAHTYQDFESAVLNAKKCGINDINADILLGVPTQTKQDIIDTLNLLIEQPLTHISAYGLINEEGTPLTKAIQAGELDLPSEESAVEMYDLTVDFLKKHGFYRYEISNFAKKGFESIHNLNYWNRGEYLGLGLNAYSFVDRAHWRNTENFNDYINNPLLALDYEKETEKTAKEETIMLALRTEKGLNINEYNTKFKTDFLKDFSDALKRLEKNKLIKFDKGNLKIVNFSISNAIILEFFKNL